MDPRKKTLLYNLGALLCAVCYLATSWLWVYYFNIVFSLPAAVAAYLLWKTARKREPDNLLNKFTMWVLFAGTVSALLALLLYK